MKNGLLIVVLGLLFLGLLSCQKDINGDSTNQTPPPPQGGTQLYRIQQGIDPDLDNDTVWKITYYPSGKIRSITDSLYEDSLVAVYDASGRLTAINETYGDNASLTYDAGGLLTEIRYTAFGTKEKWIFTYASGVVTKKSYYSDFGSGGALTLWRDYVYTFTSGNITTIKEYTSSGVLTDTKTFMYGSQANKFKDLSLFNFVNRLGTDYLINFETYFNKNLLTGVSTSGTTTADINYNYTFNSQQLLTKAVTTEPARGVFTWQFYYK